MFSKAHWFWVYRLSWLTNSALLFEPKCGGRRGVAGVSANEHTPNKLWIFNSIFNLWVSYSKKQGGLPPECGLSCAEKWLNICEVQISAINTVRILFKLLFRKSTKFIHLKEGRFPCSNDPSQSPV